MTRTESRIFDEYLVASARAGDRRAFRTLVERWQHRLLAHAWRLLGDSEAARDAVQDGWAEIVRGLGGLQDARAFPAWAYRIVSRRCARHIAGAVRRRAVSDAIEREPPALMRECPGTGRDVDRVLAGMRTLSPGQRAAIALFHLEEMSVAEVAVALALPVGTVKTRLMHARHRLRDLFEGEE